jgi:hypothetical protein
MKGNLSTVDLLVLSSLDWMLLISKTLFTFYQRSYINEEVNRTKPTCSVRDPSSEKSYGSFTLAKFVVENISDITFIMLFILPFLLALATLGKAT